LREKSKGKEQNQESIIAGVFMVAYAVWLKHYFYFLFFTVCPLPLAF